MPRVPSDDATSRAVVLRRPSPFDGSPAPDRLRLERRPDPEPAAGEVLIDVDACAVCRTDLQLCEGDLAARRLPVVPGHQIVGRVARTGAGVTGHAPGDLVGVAWLARACGECTDCVRGRENLCESATFTGWDRDGGFAERTTADAGFVYRLPDGIDPLAAAPLLCGGVIGYRCLHIAEITPGATVGLYGFGASATCVIQILLHWGCEVFVATRSPAEQDRARRLGAVWAGGYDEPPPVALDAAITFAPSGDVVVDALRAVRRGGIVAINAIHLDRIPQFPYELLWWERQLRSVANVTRDDVAGLLRLAAELPIRTETELFGLEAAPEALQRLRDGRISGAAVLDISGRGRPSRA
ncbi:MAG: zinc-dependent alcohol dehydrogenase family protein [Acidimicrobiales bacterium]|nr:zinc-dependent alcohol dehydrogenase family protein [Acidimicrobiales bacterium]